MRKTKRTNPFIPLLIALSLLFTSCIQNGSGGGKRKRSSQAIGDDNGGSGGNGSGNGAGQEDGTIGGNNNLTSGRAEVRHIVDPFDGTYKTKVTIPKNFTGLLFLAGLNITSLSDRIVSVRFNFGREMEPVVIPATIGRAPGIIPQTDIEVLILDMDDRPFENIRLLYDLYDYNDYRETGAHSETKNPVEDPRDGNLFCRGLRLEHDPTFVGSSNDNLCNQAGERCLYAYAKVEDSTLATVDGNGNKIAGLPTEPQLDLSGTGYSNDSVANNLKKCLPDNHSNPLPISTDLESVLGAGPGIIPAALTFDAGFIFNSTTFHYRGPYRPLAFNEWEISGAALYSDSNHGTASVAPTGVFQKTFGTGAITDQATADAGMRSFLFPRSGKLDLQAGVDYFGSTTPFAGSRTVQNLLAAGKSNFVDGCNIRMVNADPFSGEGISSCNVTATIELITVDPTTGEQKLIDQTTTSQVKLQLTRPSITNFQGQEVLFTSMKTCSNSNACGASECCFNSRCWSKDLVNQCLEDVDVVGNRAIGQICASDYECSSFCCNQSTGSCAVHINTVSETVLCSKVPGQTCVSKEFCRQENIPVCKIVRTGVDVQGQTTCALKCLNVPTFGDCVNGTCTPPPVPTVPEFDASNPDCTEAIDPEDF